MKVNDYSGNRVIIDRSALRHNYAILKKKAAGKEVLAMVKADGYGHGMVECARTLEADGCNYFGVAEAGEGLRLREAGIKGHIIIFLGIPQVWFHLLTEYKLTPVLGSRESILQLLEYAEKQQQTITFYLKVDTGMGRLGVAPENVEEILERVEKSSFLEIGSVISHLARADERESSATAEAIKSFEVLKNRFSDRISQFQLANSGGILFHKESHFDFVRAGISLYGYYPDGNSHTCCEEKERLVPVLRFVTKIIQVKAIEADRGISYGHTYMTDKKTVVAVLPVGYGNGLSRSHSNRGYVLVNGQKAPVIGRVCMNMTMVDVTAIDDVKVGDEVVLIGSMGDQIITADDLGKTGDTISYEVLCTVGNNNTRMYMD